MYRQQKMKSKRHGCKDAFTLTTLKDFDPDEHQQTSGETFTPIQDGGKAEDTSY